MERLVGQIPKLRVNFVSARESWAEHVRGYVLDVSAFPLAVERLRHIATIFDPRVTRKSFKHLGRPSRAPPRAGVRVLPLFWRGEEDSWS